MFYCSVWNLPIQHFFACAMNFCIRVLLAEQGVCTPERNWRTGLQVGSSSKDGKVQPAFLGRPERSVPDGLMFYRRCFLSFFRHVFSKLHRPIALKLSCGWNLAEFYNPTPKIPGGAPLKKFGGLKNAKFRSILDHSPLWTTHFDREYLRNG